MIIDEVFFEKDTFIPLSRNIYFADRHGLFWGCKPS
jgi:hypothetical protein